MLGEKSGPQIQSDTARDPLSIPIELSRTLATGRQFTERATIVAICRYGAMVALRHTLSTEETVTIRCLGAEREASVHVIGQTSKSGDRYVYGLSFDDPNTNPWIGNLSSAMESQEIVCRQMLDCDACKTREVVYLDSIQIEVLKVNASLSRPCKQCANWTIWRLAEHELALGRALRANRAEKARAYRPQLPRNKNERRRFRVKLKKFKACIRRPGFVDEVVRVENVTRDGFRFRSHKVYAVDSTVEVAIPYMPDSPNIFVAAQIVRSRLEKQGEKVEYGVAYVDGQPEL